MYRIVAHLVLSAVLIFQGVGAVCADGQKMPDMAGQAMATSQAMAAMGASTAKPCQGCPACPEGSKGGSDCLKNCSLPAGLPCAPAIARDVPLSDALVSVPRVSLVEFVEVPPTPPPIA